ncbi:hypothetical protein F4780DRAFT_762505 [Xylariomycetidae sp. FL0641]|nr:hypothetical protein F4780DRAFT_762505 [Xylariomycetidae sp. FL0641]
MRSIVKHRLDDCIPSRTVLKASSMFILGKCSLRNQHQATEMGNQSSSLSATTSTETCSTSMSWHPSHSHSSHSFPTTRSLNHTMLTASKPNSTPGFVSITASRSHHSHLATITRQSTIAVCDYDWIHNTSLCSTWTDPLAVTIAPTPTLSRTSLRSSSSASSTRSGECTPCTSLACISSAAEALGLELCSKRTTSASHSHAAGSTGSPIWCTVLGCANAGCADVLAGMERLE